MGILSEILATKRDEVTILRHPRTRALLKSAALAAGPCRDFSAALRRSDGLVAVIAEIKRKSPSKGPLAPDLDPAVLASKYAQGGAACLSVLTDLPYFGGMIEDLRLAHDAAALPVLRKDFVIDEIQVYETRAVGADAMLLIVAALDDVTLRDLHAMGTELGLAVLVETHDEAELERAIAAGAHVIGVNSRSLQTFGEDLKIAERLRAMIPPSAVAIAESAVRSSVFGGRGSASRGSHAVSPGVLSREA